jgi:hypothetical protein
VHIGRQLGALDRIDGLDITALFDRYQIVYGQPAAEQDGSTL